MRASEFIIESQNAADVLKYVKSIHHDFHIDDTILTHPRWELKRVPLNQLHVPDPESGEDLDDPYNRVQMIDMYHVDDITARDIESKPIVVDTDGHIIDGNHRALAARLSGMRDIPAYVPARHNMKISEVERLGRSVKYPFYSIFNAVRSKTSGGLSISLRKDRPAETRQSGIYVWYHPDWGYFYVGIAAADNFTERWNKHIQKLLDQCTSAKQMRNWQTFSQKFAAAGYGIDDLKDITLRFYPRPNTGSPTFKKDLEALETRIVSTINPMCNKEYDPSKPSSTRIPPNRTTNETTPVTPVAKVTNDPVRTRYGQVPRKDDPAPKTTPAVVLHIKKDTKLVNKQ